MFGIGLDMIVCVWIFHFGNLKGFNGFDYFEQIQVALERFDRFQISFDSFCKVLDGFGQVQKCFEFDQKGFELDMNRMDIF